jgi:hypothetical protein
MRPDVKNLSYKNLSLNYKIRFMNEGFKTYQFVYVK